MTDLPCACSVCKGTYAEDHSEQEPDLYLAPWAESIFSYGEDIVIPWLAGDGTDVHGIRLPKARATVLKDMLEDFLGDE